MYFFWGGGRFCFVLFLHAKYLPFKIQYADVEPVKIDGFKKEDTRALRISMTRGRIYLIAA